MGFLKEVEKAKDARGALLRLWGYVQRQRWALIATLFLVAVTTLLD